MSTCFLDTAALRILKEYSQQTKVLDTDFVDCPMCHNKTGHYNSKKWRYIPLAAANIAALMTYLFNHQANFSDYLVAFVFTYIATLLISTSVTDKLDIRARRKIHNKILQNLRPTARIMRALIPLLQDIRITTSGTNGLLKELITEMPDAFLQRVSIHQYELLQKGGQDDKRSELLSAISRTREMRQTLVQYTENADKWLINKLYSARILACKATLLNQIDTRSAHSHLFVRTNELRMLKAADMIFASAKNWSENLRTVYEDPGITEPFHEALNADLDHDSAVASLEQLISRLPQPPHS